MKSQFSIRKVCGKEVELYDDFDEIIDFITVNRHVRLSDYIAFKEKHLNEETTTNVLS